MEKLCCAVPVNVIRDRSLGIVTQNRFRTIAYNNRLDSLRILYKHPLENVTSPVSCMDIDKVENSFLLCGGISGRIYLSNLYYSDVYGSARKEKFILPKTFGHKYYVSGCQWYHDIRLFVSASCNGELTAWDLTSLTSLETYKVSESGKWKPELHWNEIDKSNPLIAITNGTNQIPLYDLRVGDLAQAIRSNVNSLVRAVRWLPSKHHILFSGDSDGMISCWDVRSNRTALSSIVIRQKKAIKGLRLSSDGKHLIVVLHTGTVILCDAITMEVLAQYETKHPKKSNYEMSHAFGHVALCDEGSSIRVALPLGDNVEWISFSKGYRQEPRFLYSSTLIAHLSMVNACVYRNGSQQLYTAGSDNNVICWAPESEKNRLKLDAETVKKSLFMNDWSDDD